MRPFQRGHGQAPENEDKRQAEEGSWGTLRFLISIALLAWALRSLVVTPFSIPSGSMLPTLYIGDYLMVAKWPYGYSRYSFPFQLPSFDGRIFGRLPNRGDVVVFRHPSDDIDLIKRVIAVPGDVIAVRGGSVVLNGHLLPRQELRPYRLPISGNTPCATVPPARPTVDVIGDERFCVMRAVRETLPGGPSYTVFDQVPNGVADDFAATRVPAGHLFLMGDNRDNSLDSRFAAAEGGTGMVPVENLIGRAAVTFWSTDGEASYLKPWTWLTSLRARRIGNGYAGDAE